MEYKKDIKEIAHEIQILEWARQNMYREAALKRDFTDHDKIVVTIAEMEKERNELAESYYYDKYAQ